MSPGSGAASEPRRSAALAVLLGLVALASCTTVRGVIETRDALSAAGFEEVDVGFDSREGLDRLDVTVRPLLEPTSLGEEAERAAQVVWTTFPLRVDIFRVEVLGPGEARTATYTAGEMADLFGPRPADLGDEELGDDVVRTGVAVGAVLLVAGVVVVAGLTVATVLAVRSSRRRKAMPPPPWPPVPEGPR